MNYTDTQLQIVLAKMLSDRISFVPHRRFGHESEEPDFVNFYWKPNTFKSDFRIKDTEWLHLAWLVEEALPQHHKNEYGEYVLDEYGIHASWQQRAVALAKVKEVEIV